MRTLGIILLLLALILLGHTVIEFSFSYAYDPPSVFNHGPGGVANFVSILVSKGFDVETVLDVSNLLKIDPLTTVAMLFSPDVPLTKEEASTILSWVKSGGTAIVLDELHHVDNLTNVLGVTFSNYSVRTYDIAICSVKNVTLPVVLDVYRYVNGGEPLCTIDNKAVAVTVSYGRGKVIVVGDSSLIINHILYTIPKRSNLLFLLLLITGKSKVVFLELHRVRYILRIAYPLLPLQSMLRMMQLAIGGFFTLDPIAKAIVLTLILTLSAILSVLIISHEARISRREVAIKMPEPQPRLSIQTLKNLVREGLRSWLES